MAKFHARGIAALLFLALILAGAPSWAMTPKRSSRAASRASFREEVARVVRLVLGRALEKTGNTLDPNGGSGSSQLSLPGGAPDTGNTLDPNG